MCDLNTNIVFRTYSLNSVSQSTSGISGCQIDSIDHSEVEIRQFTEPYALKNGIDVGGVWLGGRHVRITGTVYGTTRAAAFAAIASLDAVMLPEAGTFGYYLLPLTEGDLYVRPNGLRVVWDRRMYGGDAADPLAIPWSVTMYARDPDFAAPGGGGGGGGG
jgi:hypothetical protein